MRTIKSFIILSTFLLSSSVMASAATPSQRHQSVGLVLSGGGAKGIGHIGAIKALEDNDIPIDYITGTSMGAIVGSLYAAGYSTDEMMELILSPYFGYMSTGKIDPEFTYYFSTPRPSPQMFSFQLGSQSKAQKDFYNPQSLVSPAPMAFGFMEIYGGATARCQEDFNKLFVPFRCVSSNMTKLHKHVFGHGNLAECVRASMSFPLVFQAVKLDGDMYYDGGVFDNFPVEVMHREFDPSIMLGFDVSATSSGPPNSYLDQLDLLVTRPQSYEVPEEYGMKIRIDLNEFGLLDFQAAKAIYQVGYDRTMEMMDSIKARVHTRMPAKVRQMRRKVFRAGVPELRFADINVTGASKKQNEYIRYLFGDKGDTINVDRARLAYYRALASDKLNAIVPTATPVDSTGLFNLDLLVSVKRKFDVGGGAFVTSSNNSFLYLRAGYSSLSFSSVNANIEAWIGQSYMAGMLSGSIYLPSQVPSAFRFEAVASRRRFHDNEKLFFRDNEPTFVVDHEYFGKINYALATGRKGEVEVGLGGGRIYNSFYRNNNPESYRVGRDNIGLNLAQAFVGYNSSTIDNEVYPTIGFSRHGNVAGVLGKSHFFNALAPADEAKVSRSEKWMQLHWRERDYFNLHKHWALGIEGELMVSSRPLFQSYYASITTAPAFTPTPASNNYFDPGLRANSFAALSLIPIYKYNSSLSARLSASCFLPERAIVELPDGAAAYAKRFSRVRFFGEFDVVYTLPFATVAAYCNYSNSRHHFNVGISLGMYLTAPRFLK